MSIYDINLLNSRNYLNIIKFKYFYLTNMFSFNNRYTTDQLKQVLPRFRDAINNNSYPLRQSKVQDIRMNYLPLNVNKKDFDEVKKDLINVVTSIIKVINYYQKKGTLKEKLGLSDIEYNVFKDIKSESFIGVLRFDLLFSKSGFKIVEIDADPDALFLHDFSFNTLSSYFPSNYSTKYPNHYDLYLRLMNEIGIKEKSNGLILIDPNVKFIEEYEINKRIFSTFGFQTEYKPYSPGIDFSKYDFVKKAYEFHRIINKDVKLLQSLKKVLTINTMPFRLLGYKNLFKLLHSELKTGILSASEIESIKSIVPKTKVYDSATLSQEIIDNKDNSVLKPILGAEGEDVYIGNMLSKKEWKKLLTEKVKPDGTWLYQELVETSKVNYIDQDHLKTAKKRYFDFSPHLFVFKNEMVFGKNLVRYSDNQILNVAQGGTFGYGIEV